MTPIILAADIGEHTTVTLWTTVIICVFLGGLIWKMAQAHSTLKELHTDFQKHEIQDAQVAQKVSEHEGRISRVEGTIEERRLARQRHASGE